eukprot:355645-Chlamydomonas_euryale.AAC.22
MASAAVCLAAHDRPGSAPAPRSNISRCGDVGPHDHGALKISVSLSVTHARVDRLSVLVARAKRRALPFTTESVPPLALAWTGAATPRPRPSKSICSTASVSSRAESESGCSTLASSSPMQSSGSAPDNADPHASTDADHDGDEALLRDNPDRFSLFPIQ